MLHIEHRTAANAIVFRSRAINSRQFILVFCITSCSGLCVCISYFFFCMGMRRTCAILWQLLSQHCDDPKRKIKIKVMHWLRLEPNAQQNRKKQRKNDHKFCMSATKRIIKHEIGHSEWEKHKPCDCRRTSTKKSIDINGK